MSDNDDQSMDNSSINSSSTTDSMLEDDNTVGREDEGGCQGGIPRGTARTNIPTQQSSLRRESRARPEIDYKALS